MWIAGVLVALAAAVVIGQAAGWRWVLAPLLGFAIIRWSLATFGSMAAGVHGGDDNEAGPTPVGPDERTLYWCEECGTEVLLLVRGSGAPLRHCGTRMLERTELRN